MLFIVRLAANILPLWSFLSIYKMEEMIGVAS
jgi:hypothetical protein